MCSSIFSLLLSQWMHFSCFYLRPTLCSCTAFTAFRFLLAYSRNLSLQFFLSLHTSNFPYTNIPIRTFVYKLPHTNVLHYIARKLERLILKNADYLGCITTAHLTSCVTVGSIFNIAIFKFPTTTKITIVSLLELL